MNQLVAIDISTMGTVVGIIASIISILGATYAVIKYLLKRRTNKIKSDYLNYINVKLSTPIFDRISISFSSSDIEDVSLNNVFVDLDVKLISAAATNESVSDAFQKSIKKDSSYKSFRLAIKEALEQKRNALAFIGEPGSGKSTLLKYIATSVHSKTNKKMGFPKSVLPIYIECCSLFQEEDFDIKNYLCKTFVNDTQKLQFKNLFEAKLRKGQILFLVDALDEITDVSAREKMANYINDLASAPLFSKNIFILTCRTSVYPRHILKQFNSHILQGFSDEKIKSFSSNVLLSLDHKSNEADVFINSVNSSKTLRNLSGNPLFLSILLCLFIIDGVLPKHQTSIFKRYIEILSISFIRKFNESVEQTNKTQNLKIDEQLFENILLQLASKIMCAQSGYFLIEELNSIIISKYFEYKGIIISKFEANYISKNILLNSGFFLSDVNIENGQKFFHKYIAEYFCAVNMYNTIGVNAPESLTLLASEVKEKYTNSKWDNAVKMLCEKYYLNEQFGYVWQIIDALIDAREILGDMGANYVLAAECIVYLHLYQMDGAIKHINRCAKKLLTVLEKDVYLIQHKIKAAKMLSYLGDPRFISYEHIPQMVDIHSGSFNMGTQEEDIEKYLKEINKIVITNADAEAIRQYWQRTLITEKYKKIIIKKDFRISRFLITNAQYQQFLQETGYDVPSISKDETDSATLSYYASHKWNETSKAFPEGESNYPVTFVSFNDAKEYCKWLSQKTGRNFRLPTEEEWEYAARGNKSHKFPWGNDWQDKVANTTELSSFLDEYDIKAGLLPVGCFNLSDSIFGVSDCSGQVWEWTESSDTLMDDPAKYIPGGDNEEESRIVKGGAWDDNFVFARCAARGPNKINLKKYYIGFRIIEEL